jgi:hypothetical protein
LQARSLNCWIAFNAARALYQAFFNVCFVGGKGTDVRVSLVVCVTPNGFVSAASVSPKTL